MRQPEKDPGRAIIGGEFELEHITPRSKPALSFLTRIIEGTWTASGRSSLALILAHLKARGVEHIHLPSYLCASILQPVESIGLEYSFYPVDDNFNAWPDPPDGSAVLLIHYFGWMNSARAALIDGAKRGKYWLIEDMSHALLSNWEIPDSDRNFIFFSARKLGPAPAGGWCNIHHELSETGKELILLVNKSVEMRLARARYLAEIQGPIDQQFENEYISLFREVENYLDNDPTVMPLPSLGLDIISGVDWENAKKKAAQELDLTQ